MVAVITADLVNSRSIADQGVWIHALEELLGKKNRPGHWEIFRGDSLQLLIEKPERALMEAVKIKSLIKSTGAGKSGKRSTSLDIRMAIGIGDMAYTGAKVTESNGSAFVNAGEQFEELRKGKIKMALRSPWPELDREMNLYFRLAGVIMDNWTSISAKTIHEVLKHPDDKQQDLAKRFGINQNAVSNRLKRAGADEIRELIHRFERRVKEHML